MKMPLLFISTLTLLVSGCVGYPAPADGQKTIYVCQGSGCSQNSATFPSRAETHKPTKDEKIRARRGEDPDFGSEERHVGGTLPLSW